MNNSNMKKAIILMLFICFITSLMSALIKLAGPISAVQKTFIRSLVCLIVSFIWLRKNKSSLRVEKRAVIPLFIRSFFGISAIALSFYSYQNMKLADATMIMKLGPFFIAVWSLIILREQVKTRTWIGYAISLLGCVLIIKPSGSGTIEIAAFAALGNAMCVGLGLTMLRILGVQGVSGKVILFYLSLFGLIVTLPFVLFDYNPMDTKQVMFLVGEGLLASLFHVLNAKCFQYAPGNKISIYSYPQLIFSGILGFFLFKEIPGVMSFLGYAIIIGVAYYLYWKDRKEDALDRRIDLGASK